MYVVISVQQNKYINLFMAKFKDSLNDKSDFYKNVKVLTHFWISDCKIFHQVINDLSIYEAHFTFQH